MPDTTLPTADEVQGWPGMQVEDSAGTAVGTVRSVYGDDHTGVPEWVEVALPDDGLAYVPVLGTTASEQGLRLAHAAERIAGAPRFAADAKLEVADERALYDHYGVETSQELSDTLLPAAAEMPGGTTPKPAASTTEPVAAPPPAATSRPRRIEQAPAVAPTPMPAPVPPPAPVTPAPAGAASSSPGRKAALLLAVPAVLLLARRLRRGGLSLRRSRTRRVTPAAVLLAPVAAGGVAAVLQRRTRREQQHPVEVGIPLTGPVVIGAASVPADRT